MKNLKFITIKTTKTVSDCMRPRRFEDKFFNIITSINIRRIEDITQSTDDPNKTDILILKRNTITIDRPITEVLEALKNCEGSILELN
jgi:hypothetical protein